MLSTVQKRHLQRCRTLRPSKAEAFAAPAGPAEAPKKLAGLLSKAFLTPPALPALRSVDPSRLHQIPSVSLPTVYNSVPQSAPPAVRHRPCSAREKERGRKHALSGAAHTETQPSGRARSVKRCTWGFFPLVRKSSHHVRRFQVPRGAPPRHRARGGS